MEAIKLVLTEAFLFRKEDAQVIRGALSLSMPVSEPSWHVRCSIDPPQFIELLGSVDTWEILKTAAQVFLLAFGRALGKPWKMPEWSNSIIRGRSWQKASQ